MNKLTIVNRIVLHTLHRNFTRLAIITRKAKTKIEKRKGEWKRAKIFNTLNEPHSSQLNS